MLQGATGWSILSSFFLLAGMTFAGPQRSHVLSGQVLDPDNNPLGNVRIKIIRGSEPAITVRSDPEKGTYSITFAEGRPIDVQYAFTEWQTAVIRGLSGVRDHIVHKVLYPSEKQRRTVARIVELKVRAGMGEEFEQGLKRHADWHRRENNPWAYDTWQIISGEQTGQYYLGMFDRRWEDFDTDEELASVHAADTATNIEQYVEKAPVSFYSYLADISRPFSSEGPKPLTELRYLHLNVGTEVEFTYAIRKAHEAIEKTNWPTHYQWYSLDSGGEHPTFVLALPRDNWADFAPQEKSFVDVLAEAYGRTEAQSLIEILGKSVHCERSEIIRYRPDLSYVPENP